jgi:TM2 domain-containing membrane protein YozV
MRCTRCSKELTAGTTKCSYCGFTFETNNIKDTITTFKMQNIIANQKRKDWLTTLLLCLFLGFLGIHRFYTGNRRVGTIQLLTTGGFGIWILIDLVAIITGSYRDGEGKPLIHRN